MINRIYVTMTADTVRCMETIYVLNVQVIKKADESFINKWSIQQTVIHLEPVVLEIRAFNQTNSTV